MILAEIVQRSDGVRAVHAVPPELRVEAVDVDALAYKCATGRGTISASTSELLVECLEGLRCFVCEARSCSASMQYGQPQPCPTRVRGLCTVWAAAGRLLGRGRRCDYGFDRT